MPKQASLKTLRNKCDRVFSEYIRKRDSREGGLAQCCTCGKWDHWKDMDNGHFVNRSYLSVRFDERNCAIQCRHCNRFKEGNIPEFFIYIEKRWGRDVVDDLLTKKHWVSKFTRQCYEDMIAEFRTKIARLEYFD